MLSKVYINAQLFINEPGDATHYEFILTRVGEIYHILDFRGDLALPATIPHYEVLPSTRTRDFSDALIELAKELSVNPNTLNQVMLAIELYDAEVPRYA